MPIHQNIIDNPKSERVRRVADLSNRRSRERSGRFLAEGPQSVREAVRCMPQTVTDVYVAVSDDPERSRLDPGLARHGYEGTPETMPDDVPVSALLSPIVAEAVKAGLYVHLCSAGVIERMSRDAQGIVAVGGHAGHKGCDDRHRPRNAGSRRLGRTPITGGGLLAGA